VKIKNLPSLRGEGSHDEEVASEERDASWSPVKKKGAAPIEVAGMEFSERLMKGIFSKWEERVNAFLVLPRGISAGTLSPLTPRF